MAIVGFPGAYKTPSAIGTIYSLLNLSYYGNVNTPQNYWVYNGLLENNGVNYGVKVENKNGTQYYRINADGEFLDSTNFTIAEGENKITYNYDLTHFYTIYPENGNPYLASDSDNYLQTFTIYGVENRLPLLPYTVNDVIQRVLQLVEPLRKTETPRFSFTPPTGAKAEIFSKFAPEFTFTRNMLREALQQIGGYIHAEPRLNADMSLDWDFYGEEEKAQYTNYKTGITKDLSLYKYRTLQRKRNLDETANALDSYQQNLVNRLNWENATTATPYDNGWQTLRMETAWIPTEESNEYHIETVENIDRIVKVEVKYGNDFRDITPYIYDKKVYDSLSGISTVYPNAKVTSLYYIQGQKGIYGLFYKNPAAFRNGIGENYAIVNIINYAFGLSLSSVGYNQLQFRVTYVPIYSTRVQQSKQLVQDFLPLPRTVNYTQSENSVETAYFGENIKGAIARMGNAEKNITMNFRNFNNLPKVGLLFDDEYYISESSVAVLSDHFEVTLGLSKNFNRKSKYIGANSIKRIYEVSEEQVQERHTVLQDYLVITENYLENPSSYRENGYLRDFALEAIRDMFNGIEDNDYLVTAVNAFGSTKNNNIQESVLLPVISSAFGNTIEFTWRYKDNYSAGFQIQYHEGNDGLNRLFNVETEYTDYYGRLYHYYFGLATATLIERVHTVDPDLLPEYTPDNGAFVLGAASVGGYQNPLILRKDSREALKFTYAVNFVTDDNRFILGTALTANNPLITKDTRRPHLFILPNKINRFSSYLDLEGATDLGEVYAFVAPDDHVYLNDEISTADGQAWAYAYPITQGETKQFENENGEIVPVPTNTGGELILGKNVNIKNGDYFGAVSIYPVHDIYKYYDYLKQKNN